MMSPTVALRDGELVLGLGSGGSNRIRSAITQTIIRYLGDGLEARASGRRAPRPLRGRDRPRRAGGRPRGAERARGARLRGRPLARAQPLFRRRPRRRRRSRRAPRPPATPPRRRRRLGLTRREACVSVSRVFGIVPGLWPLLRAWLASRRARAGRSAGAAASRSSACRRSRSSSSSSSSCLSSGGISIWAAIG